MTASLNTIKYRAPPAAPEGQQLLSSFRAKAAQDRAQAGRQASSQNPNNPPADQQAPPENPEDPNELPEISEAELAAQIRELSHDLVVKEQQLETLIRALPGKGVSEKEQWDRMRELERELKELEGEEAQALKEKEDLLRKVEAGIMKTAGVGL
jgi:mediator of RNA polymerase II transcription subunit 21